MRELGRTLVDGGSKSLGEESTVFVAARRTFLANLTQQDTLEVEGAVRPIDAVVLEALCMTRTSTRIDPGTVDRLSSLGFLD